MVFQKEIYNCIQNVTVWPVLRKRLHLKEHKLSIAQHFEGKIVCTHRKRHDARDSVADKALCYEAEGHGF
jgi:hypothetical protein